MSSEDGKKEKEYFDKYSDKEMLLGVSFAFMNAVSFLIVAKDSFKVKVYFFGFFIILSILIIFVIKTVPLIRNLVKKNINLIKSLKTFWSISIVFSILFVSFLFASQGSLEKVGFITFSFLFLGITLSITIFHYVFRKIFLETIKNPPATFLSRVAELLPSKYKKNLKQNISDMRIEYFNARQERKNWEARVIVASYYTGLCWSVVMWISDKIKEVIKIIPKKN